MANAKRMCTGCKDRFPTEGMIKLPAGHFHSFDCSISYAMAKQLKKRSKAAKVKHKADKERAKTFRKEDLKRQHRLTQAVFNKMRVLQEKLWFSERGREPECISCGKPLGGDQWCCGHFKTRGAQSGLRYDPKNTFIQHNFNCNMNLSGDIEGSKNTRGYKQGLLVRFGEDEGQAIIDYCETKTAPVKWSWQQLEEMRSDFNSRIRELLKG